MGIISVGENGSRCKRFFVLSEGLPVPESQDVGGLDSHHTILLAACSCCSCVDFRTYSNRWIGKDNIHGVHSARVENLNAITAENGIERKGHFNAFTCNSVWYFSHS